MSDGATPDHDTVLDDLVHAADLDALVRLIDDRTATRDWDGLLRVRDRTRHAVETGRQVWPAATLAEYRLALLAPAPFVAAVLDESDGLTGRFTIGPLTEVAAQHHTWAELAPHLDPGPRAAFVAHERAIRGETIPAADADALPPVLEIPVEPRPWEPRYPVAIYGDVDAQFPAPTFLDSTAGLVETPLVPPGVRTGRAAEAAEVVDDPDVDLAVRQLVEPWTVGSDGHVEVACVEKGSAADAIAALGVRRARLDSLPSADALAWLAWAGASGGAHGRRRGAAAGRFGVWWLLAALGDLTEEFPEPASAFADLVDELHWFRWDAFEPVTGWRLQLAVESPADRVAWAMVARDAE